jgi:hypothetical protein
VALQELIAEIRAAASSLTTAADAAESGDLVAAEIGIEDALFRTESILSRIRQTQIPPETDDNPPPSTNGQPPAN